MMRYLLTSFLFALPFGVFAQIPYEKIDSVDAGNINARVGTNGILWTNTADGLAAAEFPKGSDKAIGFGCGILIRGYENGNVLHLSGALYPDYSNPTLDFYPGPLDNAGNTNITTIDKWAKIWKIEETDITAFLAQTVHTTGNTPTVILQWPAKGNQYATGNNNAPLTITEDMAPFHDFNNNGTYEPLQGEYPVIKGQQMLWWVVNDNGLTHDATNGAPLKVQIEIAAYAFAQGGLIENVVYYDYTIKNKSAINYTNVRFGQLTDFDLGLYSDDYVGFDSARRMGYNYNGDNMDGTGNYSYGSNIPIAGLTFVRVPGDQLNTYVPLGGFSHLANIYISTSASYFNDALDTMISGFNECTSGNPTGDRNFVIGTGNFTLNAGASESVVTALVVVDPGQNTSCPGVDSGLILEVADTAWGQFSWSLSASEVVSNKNMDLRIYPNPAGDRINIDVTGLTARTDIEVYDVLGKKQTVGARFFNKTAMISIDQLTPGIYHVFIAELNASGTFIKK
ncbi:MAG TPA: T9SS type A sorting domain-containing protein [Flavipsychrobacter sp.]|nr:T9SS type A sorting domain-containing protein [Flavipsychrobacter sp.]